MKKIKTADLIAELFNSFDDADKDFCDMLADYPDDYICDAISSYADSQVNIYYWELAKWLREDQDAIEYMEQVAHEGLINFREYDFYKHIQIAQYEQNTARLYDVMENSAGTVFLKWILSELEKDYPEITEDQEKKLDSMISEIDHNDRISNILDRAREILESSEE